MNFLIPATGHEMSTGSYFAAGHVSGPLSVVIKFMEDLLSLSSWRTFPLQHVYDLDLL